MKRTTRTMIRVLGLALVAAFTLGAQPASAELGLQLAPQADSSCNGAFEGNPEGSLRKSASRDGVALANYSTVVPGDVVEFTFTWNTADYLGPTLDKLMDCFTLNGKAYDYLEASWKPTANDGVEVHKIAIPDLDEGDILCDRGRLSGLSSIVPGSITQKSNVVCLVVAAAQQAEPGRISISKRTPDGATEKFTFVGHIAATLGNGEKASEVVPAGTYHVSEEEFDGWYLFDITCDDDDSTGNVDNRTATFKVAPGESVHCVFTNEPDGAGSGEYPGQGDEQPGEEKPGEEKPGQTEPTPDPKVLGDRPALPKTGVGIALLLASAASLLGAGVVLRRMTRREEVQA